MNNGRDLGAEKKTSKPTTPTTPKKKTSKKTTPTACTQEDDIDYVDDLHDNDDSPTSNDVDNDSNCLCDSSDSNES